MCNFKARSSLCIRIVQNNEHHRAGETGKPELATRGLVVLRATPTRHVSRDSATLVNSDNLTSTQQRTLVSHLRDMSAVTQLQAPATRRRYADFHTPLAPRKKCLAPDHDEWRTLYTCLSGTKLDLSSLHMRLDACLFSFTTSLLCTLVTSRFRVEATKT